MGDAATGDKSSAKRCPRCEESKPASDFYMKNGRPNGWCKPCMATRYRRDFDRSERACALCGIMFTPRRPGQENCSRSCKTARRNRLASEARQAAKAGTARACVVCGNPLPSSARADKRYCSDSCTRRARKHIGNAQRRMRVPDQMQAISRADVYARDGWVCQLCGEAVDPEREYPDPLAASLDHVVPLSRGGTHESTNLQLAHLSCNARARDMKANLDPRPPIIIEGRDYYRVPEAAEMIGTTYSVLDTAIRSGRVSVFQLGRYRYLTAQTVAELQSTGLPDGRQVRSQQAAEARAQRQSDQRRACRECGALFDFPNPDRRRRYCSDDCQRNNRRRRKREAASAAASPVTSWEQPCTTCGRPFTVTSDRPRRYSCSPECAKARKLERERLKNPRRGPGTCASCGTALPPRTKPGHPAVTCSPTCRDEWRRERLRRNQERKAKG